jgi:hypothetical protein
VGIAATLVIASGAGFLYLNSRDAGTPVATEAAPAESDAVGAAPEARGFALTDSGPPLAAGDSAVAGTTPPALDSARTLAANAAPSEAASSEREAFAPGALGAAAQPARESDLAAKAVEPPRAEVEAGADTEAATRRAELAAADEAAGQAAREQRAPEAAALQRAAPAAVSAAPPPAPRPPTVDERARIAMRIGLDEAQRMLGSAVHVIEGMRPELVGLIPGRLVRGANASEYVVRVVYQDEEGRLIFLDQQRLDAAARQMGAQRDTTPPEWVVGETFLSLSGEVGREAIRALAARVR